MIPEERYKIRITKGVYRTVTQEDLFDSRVYETMEDNITNHRRWSVEHTVIVRDLKDGTFWMGCYDVGATENQDGGYDGDVEMWQVTPIEKTVVTYVAVAVEYEPE